MIHRLSLVLTWVEEVGVIWREKRYISPNIGDDYLPRQSDRQAKLHFTLFANSHVSQAPSDASTDMFNVEIYKYKVHAK